MRSIFSIDCNHPPKTKTITALPKKIGLLAAIALIIGSVIGSGVFMKPSSMAADLGSPVWLTIVWIIAGVFSLCGALVYAELGAMMPETGGIYVYFRKIFGDFWGYLYGWAAFSVINTASVAAIAFVCAGYADYFIHLPQLSEKAIHSFVLHIPFIGDLFPLQDLGIKLLAIAIVLFVTWMNYRSLNAGSATQVISTFLKMAAIVLLVVAIFISGKGSFANFTSPTITPASGNLLAGIIAAMTGAFFAYDGWINVTFVAGEIKQPSRNIPTSLFIGVLACIIIYLLVNQAYLFMMPVQDIAASPLVAADAIGRAWGSGASALIAAMIIICTFGSVNGNVLACSRVTFAMGKDKLFWPWTGREHKKFFTPGNALWLHAIWTCVFIFTGSFNMLADMFVFITWLAYMFGAIGVLILRKRLPNANRPYKIWGYPVVPILFILFAAFYLVFTIVSDIKNYIHGEQPVINSLLGVVITLVGALFYRRRRG